jgi:hypothetical protein
MTDRGPILDLSTLRASSAQGSSGRAVFADRHAAPARRELEPLDTAVTRKAMSPTAQAIGQIG